MGEGEIEGPASDDVDLIAEILVDEAPVPLWSFPLHSHEGRQAFLRAFTDVGETLLFEAVSHIRSSLGEPQELRCTAMGIAAGTGGKGKGALVNLLRACLDEVLTDENPLPPRAAFESLDEWHEAAMCCFAADKVRHAEIFRRCSIILDGGIPGAAAPNAGEVIRGPWRSIGSADHTD